MEENIKNKTIYDLAEILVFIAKLHEKIWALAVRLGCKSLCRCLARAARRDQNHLDCSSLWISHNQRERKITSTPTDGQRISQREWERGSSSRTSLPGVLDLTTGSGEMQSFSGHLSHFPTLPPLLLGVLQNTFAIAITSSSSWSLQNKSPTTTHNPPLPNNKSNDGHTNKTNNTTSWDSFLCKNSPLTKES